MIAWLTRGSWKTTSTGLLAIIGGIVRLIFAIKAGNLSEEAVMTILTTIITGVGLLAARDNGVSSEQVGADPASKAIKEFAKGESQSSDGGNLGKLPLWLLCGFLSLSLLTPALTGCATGPQTREAVVYKSFRTTWATVLAAHDVYCERAVLGKVKPEDMAKVDAAWNKFRAVFKVSFAAAQRDWSLPTPATLDAAERELLALIRSL